MNSPDFAALRAQFPQLRERAYMACQSFGPCPQGSYADLEAYRQSLLLRPNHLEEWIGRLEEMRSLAEELLGAPPGSVAMGPSATSLHGTVLSALEARPNRDRLLVSGLHFPSMRYLAAAQERRGFRVDVVSGDGTHLRASELVAALNGNVAAVLAPLVASFNGALLDPAHLAAAADDAGAILVLDAYSGLGVVPLDVSTLPPCVIIGGTMKWLAGGGTGLCFMYVHPALVDRLPPGYPGWLGHARYLEFDPTYEAAPGARRYEQGTPAVEPIYTARAGMRFVLEYGVASLRHRNQQLTDRLVAHALSAGLNVLSPVQSSERAASVAIEVPDAAAVVARLRAEGIDIDSRGERLVRLGPHWCVSLEECDRAIALIHDAVG